MAMTIGRSAALCFAAMVTLGAATTDGFAQQAASKLNHDGGTDESAYSPLDKITAANIQRMGLASSLDLEGEVTLEARPLAVNGVLYFSGSYSAVYAVDAVTGKLLWTYDPQIWKVNPDRMLRGLPVNRGVAYDNGRIFIGVRDGRLVALDARTGKEQWTAETLPLDKQFYWITGAPRVFKGKVIIGNGGGDLGLRGYATAYDQVTGKQVWRFYTVPGSPDQNRGDPTMEMAAKTWTGEYWKTGTGGAVWDSMTFDPELNLIYIGVGNAGPYNPAIRSPGGGDNLFLASIVALNADTGKYVWHYQQNPLEAWDYKATTNMIPATLVIGGRERKVLMQSPTNGFFYVIDRETGKLISAEKTGKVTWAERIDIETGRPVEAPGIRYEHGEVVLWPSMSGTHNWQPMSFSPNTGLVYIPYMQLGARYSANKASITGASASFVKQDAEDGMGALLAWDPVAQKPRWKMPRPFLWNGGTLATAGNLVFQGTADGYFRAHDATTGKELWQFNAGLGIVGAPVSYMVKGKQYVSVLVGWGGATGSTSDVTNVGWKYGKQPRRLLTFALGGKKSLPPSPGRDMVVHAVDDPSVVLDAADVAAGRALFGSCGSCHGRGLLGAGSPAPDLRESPLTLSEDALWAVLHDGALAPRGMPPFAALTRQQVHQIWSYIRASAREQLSKASGPTSETAKEGITSH